MLQERIDRTINNHQLSCEHLQHYLFILKGFSDVLDSQSVPLEHFNETFVETHTNYYLTFEEALSLDAKTIDALKDHHYDIWTVSFNLFKHGFLSKTRDGDFETVEPLQNRFLVNYRQPDWFEARKTISIFNTINPLIGLVDDPNLDLDNDALFDLYKELIANESKP